MSVDIRVIESPYVIEIRLTHPIEPGCTNRKQAGKNDSRCFQPVQTVPYSISKAFSRCWTAWNRWRRFQPVQQRGTAGWPCSCPSEDLLMRWPFDLSLDLLVWTSGSGSGRGSQMVPLGAGGRADESSEWDENLFILLSKFCCCWWARKIGLV